AIAGECFGPDGQAAGLAREIRFDERDRIPGLKVYDEVGFSLLLRRRTGGFRHRGAAGHGEAKEERGHPCSKSGRGQPHSKTLRALRETRVSPTDLGVRLPPAAFAQTSQRLRQL